MPWIAHRTLEDSRSFIEAALARHDREQTWAICERDDAVETCRLTPIGAIEFGLRADTIAQLDYVLAESHWHRGLASEAARAVIAWGWVRYPMVRRVIACAHAENRASQRMLETCGFHYERSFRDLWPKYAEPVEQRQYVLTRDRTSAH